MENEIRENRECLHDMSAHDLMLVNAMTEKLNRRFCADRKIPLKICSGYVFLERLALFDELDNYISYCHEVVRNFRNDQDYLETYNRVKNDAIDFIKESEAYKDLNSCDISKYISKYNFKQSNVYSDINIGKKFISIDMCKANFSALVAYGLRTNTKFFEEFNYEKFISKFTDIKHISKSKYIRQVIFGNCNPRRQVIYENHLMSLLLDQLFISKVIDNDTVYSVCSDEVILKADEVNAEKLKELYDIVEEFSNSVVPLRVEEFTLGKVVGSEAFIKNIYATACELDDVHRYELKCVNPDEAPFVYRTVKGMQFKDSDNIFDHNGKLDKFLDAPKMRIDFGEVG